jgi:tetratricopeptide (TPR) repeat protein
MMNQIIKGVLVAVSFLLLLTLLTVWLLPSAVQALPGPVRVRLPEELLRAVTIPLPTALPAPDIVPGEVQLTAESVVLVTPVIPTTTTIPQSENLATAVPTLPLASQPAITPSPTPPPSPTVNPLPTEVRLQGMEVTPQKLNNCGPTNLSINLNYYGIETTQFDVADVVKPHYDDRNVSPQELVDYANEHTPIRASLYSGGDINLLKRLLAAGFPVVIEKGYEPDDWQGWMGHYLTLVGYDDAMSSFMTMDTFLGPWDSSGRSYPYAEIEQNWEHFNNTFFVLYQPQQEEEFLQIIGPGLNDPLAMWQHAASQAQKSIDADPQNAFAWFNLGSSYSELGALTADSRFYTAAVTAFDQARLLGLPTRMLWYQFQPYVAYLAGSRTEDVLTLTATILDDPGGRDVEETYFYRGQALQAQGDSQGAAFAYQRALEIKPHYLDAKDALDSVTHKQ